MKVPEFHPYVGPQLFELKDKAIFLKLSSRMIIYFIIVPK